MAGSGRAGCVQGVQANDCLERHEITCSSSNSRVLARVQLLGRKMLLMWRWKCRQSAILFQKLISRYVGEFVNYRRSPPMRSQCTSRFSNVTLARFELHSSHLGSRLCSLGLQQRQEAGLTGNKMGLRRYLYYSAWPISSAMVEDIGR